MKEFVTADRRYHIRSEGNGWGYCVTSQATGDSFWVQDDDASQLQLDTHDFEYTDMLEAYFTT